ncbi:MAG: hypothetical protein ABH952_08435, partial [Candidatus Omnitrophota bacterium]
THLSPAIKIDDSLFAENFMRTPLSKKESVPFSGWDILEENRLNVEEVLKAFQQEDIARRFSEEMSHPEHIYPGQEWVVRQIQKTREYNRGIVNEGQETGVKLILLFPEQGQGEAYLYFAIYRLFQPYEDYTKILSLGNNTLSFCILIKVRGDPQGPKSIENDFIIIDEGKEVTLGEFLAKYYPFQGSQDPNKAGKFAVEHSGLITRKQSSGSFNHWPTHQGKGVRVHTGMIASGNFAGSRLINPQPEDVRRDYLYRLGITPTLEYHFHPSLDEPVMSGGDIKAYMKYFVQSRAIVPWAYLIVNFKKEGVLYIPRQDINWRAAFGILKKIVELIELDKNYYSAAIRRLWQGELQKYFDIVDVEFNEDGTVKQWVRKPRDVSLLEPDSQRAQPPENEKLLEAASLLGRLPVSALELVEQAI